MEGAARTSTLDGGRDPFVVFVHIPKTAGTSLRSIIQRKYGNEETLVGGYSILDYERQVEVVRSALDAKRPLQAAVGHFLPGVHRAVGRNDARYLTVLRDPVTRVLSQFHQWRRRTQRPATDDREDLAHFIDVDPRACNLQTSVLASSFGEPVQLADAAALARAKATLESFVGVGLSERFAESVLLFSDKLGWRLPFHRTLNVGPDPNAGRSVADDLLAEIARRNHLDVELYEWAHRRLEADLRHRSRSARLRAAAFPTLNRLAVRAADARMRITTRRRRSASQRP